LLTTPRRDAFRGCLLGGAVGDALGAPVEFIRSLAAIRAAYGEAGITDLPSGPGMQGIITDDTQMTLFTAEGLLRARVRGQEKGICDIPAVVHHAYRRWLRTQYGDSGHSSLRGEPDGWLITVRELHSRRGPGHTCLSALEDPRGGSIEEPINDSKGCGGIMRVAPVGLVAAEPFRLGCETAAITHGHPSGYLAAGFQAQLISDLLGGAELPDGIARAREELVRRPHHEECLIAVDAALALAEKGAPTAEKVETLGEGWVAEEALAISLYCSLVAADFASAVRLAVNHRGDSDSTGAITGNILGTQLGAGAIPTDWLAHLELRDTIVAIAGDLYDYFPVGPLDPDVLDPQRYPGW